MSDLKFSEVIKVKDGKFINLPLHIERMKRTVNHFYGTDIELSLTTEMIPPNMQDGLVKCRVLYSDTVLSVEFTPYFFRLIKNITLVNDDDIEYSYKYADRKDLDNLLLKSVADEVIVVKDGYITDCTYANLVFEDKKGKLHTPDTPLLNGIKRELLLASGNIKECRITPSDLNNYTRIYLINAMIDLDDNVSFPVENLNYLK